MRVRTLLSILPPTVGLACASSAPPADRGAAADEPAASIVVETAAPERALAACDRVTPGSPVAVCVDFGGKVYVADGSPPRIVSYADDTNECVEFQSPGQRPAFRPSDVSVRGFFVYAVDEPSRALLRWDASGSWRDVLLSFADLSLPGRRVSPYGLDVDPSTGRVAVTDVENHQVIVLDSYLNVDVVFGNYGSHEGRLDTPLGVSFTPGGELLVADSGNARVQFFSDAGAFRRAWPRAGTESPMRRPRRAVADAEGRVLVADPAAGRLFEWTPGGAVRAVVPAGAARFEPTDVAIARDGRLYVADASTQALYVFANLPAREQ